MSSNPHFINRIRLVKGDITKQTGLDAIVSSIGMDMDVRGSLNSSLIKGAGRQLDDFILDNIYKPRAGDCFAVPPFNLPVRHLIFAVTPAWRSGIGQEDRDLLNCYRNAMRLAHSMMLRRIGFPAMGTGRSGYPVNRAVRLGLQGICDRQIGQIAEIRIVCNRAETYNAFGQRLTAMGWTGYKGG